MDRRSLASRRRGRGTLALAFALVLAPTGAAGQLRPLDPAPWSIFEAGVSLSAGAGVGVHRRQRAALTGTEGRLLELGNFRAAWRSGRIALEASGTAYRVFDGESRFAPASAGVREGIDLRRTDAGDFRISTSVLLTPPEARARALLRFGTRLPTTDDGVGLDRDQTDFFALAGGQLRGARLRAMAELGVGIFGTRNPSHEQSDAVVYTFATEYAGGPVVPSLALVGHADAFDSWTPRGNEDLAELRAGVRIGDGYWLKAEWVAGLVEFSPGAGLLLTAGVLR